MKRVLLWAMAIVSLSSCIGRGITTAKSEGVSLSEREEYRYNNALANIEAVEAMMKECEQTGNMSLKSMPKTDKFFPMKRITNTTDNRLR